MKTMKNVICTVLIGLALITQLVSPTQAYADEGKHKHKGEHHQHPTTPATTEEAAATEQPAAAHTPPHQTAEPTEVPTELVPTETPLATDMPTEVVATETPTETVATKEPIATDTSAIDSAEPSKVPSESTATEAPVAQAAPTETANTAATEVPQQPATTDQTTVTSVLEQVPTETNVVVLDENGQPLPLATQEVADVIAVGDPMWCPTGVAPGGAGCTVSYTSLATLLSDLMVQNGGTGVNSDGVIWIEASYDSSVNDPGSPYLILDGSYSPTWATHALSLQGGWDGNLGSTTILPSNSIFSGPIWIFNWTGNVAVNNVTVQNTPSTGLYVDTTGTITASNITASGNGGEVILDAGGNVSLDNITVTGAATTGLHVNTAGTITANNITADNNGYIGAALLGESGVTVTGVNNFNNNANSGLWAVSNSNITLNQAMANGNGVYGADLYSSLGDITLANITASQNLSRGLLVNTPNLITASNITVTNNGLQNGMPGLVIFGDPMNAMLSNVYATGNAQSGIWLQVTNATLNGATLDFNGGGMVIFSQNTFTLNNVAANNNADWGAYIYANGEVTLEGTNTFNDNIYRGLEIIANGITLNGAATANNNLGDVGVRVRSDGQITLNNVTATGNGAFNGNLDISLFTPGNAAINNATVSSLDATAVCGTLALNQVSASNISYPTSGVHTFTDVYGHNTTITCVPKIYVNGRLLGELPQVVPTQYEFDLSCASQTLYPVNLPNGDKVTIVCPVSGRALISRLDNTTIPNDLPAGYTYASAFSVSILQADEPIPVITEGGHVEVSFQVPSQQAGSYSILFWDHGIWVPLNDFLLDPNNNPQTFDLNPGVSTDLRKIMSGVQAVTRNGMQRVEISTNFPGVFALAQH